MLTTARRLPLLAALLGLAALPATLPAQSIGGSYGDGSANTVMAATDLAGASTFAQVNWNNLTTASATALRNSLGVATTAAVSVGTSQGQLNFSPTRGGAGSPAGADERLNNGTVYTDITSIVMTLSNIPYSSYSLVVYSLNVVTSAPIRLTLGTGTTLWLRPPGNPIGAGYIDYNAATLYTYTQSTSATQAGAPANSDFVVFTGLSGASQTLTLLGNSLDGGSTFTSGLQAFQIVNTAVAAPEPGTWAFVAAGAGLLGVATLRRRRAV